MCFRKKNSEKLVNEFINARDEFINFGVKCGIGHETNVLTALFEMGHVDNAIMESYKIEDTESQVMYLNLFYTYKNKFDLAYPKLARQRIKSLREANRFRGPL